MRVVLTEFADVEFRYDDGVDLWPANRVHVAYGDGGKDEFPLRRNVDVDVDRVVEVEEDEAVRVEDPQADERDGDDEP